MMNISFNSYSIYPIPSNNGWIPFLPFISVRFALPYKRAKAIERGVLKQDIKSKKREVFE
jgi:hypothetical protein